jgi:hypothetical protein
MNSNELSATLSTNDLQEIQNAIALINQRMPFLVHLTADQRRRFKLGD